MIDYRVDKTAKVAKGASLGAFVVVDKRAVIEADVAIGPGAYIGPDVTVGKGATIGAYAIVLANVPAGAVVGIGDYWMDERDNAPHDLSADIPLPAPRGRPRKAVR